MFTIENYMAAIIGFFLHLINSKADIFDRYKKCPKLSILVLNWDSRNHHVFWGYSVHILKKYDLLVFFLIDWLIAQDAQKHALSSLSICSKLLPEQHLLLASPKRVLALILEEIAIDNEQVIHSFILFIICSLIFNLIYSTFSYSFICSSLIILIY